MESQIENLLKEMGLREYESKAYSTLLEKGVCTAEHISKFGGIPLTRVYETLASLEKRGLVVVLNTRPKRYRIVSVHSLSNLIEEKRSDMKKEIEKTEGILAKIKDMAPQVHEDILDSRKEDIWIFKGRENAFRRILDAEKETHSEILIFSDDFSFFPMVKKTLQKKIKEGVKVKLLCNINEKTMRNVKEAKAIGIDVRGWNVKGVMGDVLDNRIVYIVSKIPREGVSPDEHYGLPGDDAHFTYDCLTTRNPILINIIRTYFELFWKNGKG